MTVRPMSLEEALHIADKDSGSWKEDMGKALKVLAARVRAERKAVTLPWKKAAKLSRRREDAAIRLALRIMKLGGLGCYMRLSEKLERKHIALLQIGNLIGAPTGSSKEYEHTELLRRVQEVSEIAQEALK
jgi:hypothetical protein